MLTMSLYSEILSNSSYDLLKLLIQNEGWVSDGVENDFLFSRKLIEGKNLYALRVQKKIEFSPDIIQEILMDVNNYNQFLSKTNSIKSYELKYDL